MRLARLAARQHGVVNRKQLAHIGISDSAIQRRLAQGRLHRVHRGVYAVGYPLLDDAGRWLAAVLACGQGTVVSHFTAALLWGIYDGPDRPVHVIGRWSRTLPGIAVHRARRLHPADVTTHRGIPVTAVERTIVDLAELLPRDRVLRAIREAEVQRLLDHDLLAAAVERAHGRHRQAVLTQALAGHSAGQVVRSELEHRFLELVLDAGLPQPETNVRVATKRRGYEVDCLWRDRGVVVELDGRGAHARREAFEEDRERDSALSAVGLRPLRFTWRRVARDREAVIGELRALLAA